MAAVRRASAVAALVLAIAVVLAASAGASKGPRVAPHSGAADATFTVGFTAPTAAGVQGIFERSYAVSAFGGRRGCHSAANSRVDSATRGERVRVPLHPSGRRWCRGDYKGVVTFESGPHCERGHVCPAFVTQLKTIGRFGFRVR